MTRRTVRLATPARQMAVPFGFALAVIGPAVAHADEPPAQPTPSATQTATEAPAPTPTGSVPPAPEAPGVEAAPPAPVDPPTQAPIPTQTAEQTVDTPAPVETVVAPVEPTPVDAVPETSAPAEVPTPAPSEEATQTSVPTGNPTPSPSDTVVPTDPADDVPSPVSGDGQNAHPATPVAPADQKPELNPTTTSAPPKPGPDETAPDRPSSAGASDPATTVPGLPEDQPSSTGESDPVASAPVATVPDLSATSPHQGAHDAPCPPSAEQPSADEERPSDVASTATESTGQVIPSGPVMPSEPTTPAADLYGVPAGGMALPSRGVHDHDHHASQVKTQNASDAQDLAAASSPAEPVSPVPEPHEAEPSWQQPEVEPTWQQPEGSEGHVAPHHPSSARPAGSKRPASAVVVPSAPEVSSESETVGDHVPPSEPATPAVVPVEAAGDSEEAVAPRTTTKSSRREVKTPTPAARETTARPTPEPTVSAPAVPASSVDPAPAPARPSSTPTAAESSTVKDAPVIPTDPVPATTTAPAAPVSPPRSSAPVRPSAPEVTSGPRRPSAPATSQPAPIPSTAAVPPVQENREPEHTWEPATPEPLTVPVAQRSAPLDPKGQAPQAFPLTPPTGGKWASGLVAPLGNFSYVQKATTDRGRAASVIEMDLPGRSWDEVTDRNPVFAQARQTEGVFKWSVPLTVAGSALDDVASGRYDQQWDQFSSVLASSSTPVTVRLTMPTDADPATAKAAFRRVAQILTERSGRVQIEWVAPMGTTPEQAMASYPGSDVVTFIGVTAPLAGSWQTAVAGPGGLYDWSDFAQAQGKQIAVLWSITKDSNAPWVKNVAAWVELTATHKRLGQENVLITGDADADALKVYRNIWRAS